jgi:hypothetical protein
MSAACDSSSVRAPAGSCSRRSTARSTRANCSPSKPRAAPSASSQSLDASTRTARRSRHETTAARSNQHGPRVAHRLPVVEPAPALGLEFRGVLARQDDLLGPQPVLQAVELGDGLALGGRRPPRLRPVVSARLAPLLGPHRCRPWLIPDAGRARRCAQNTCPYHRERGGDRSRKRRGGRHWWPCLSRRQPVAPGSRPPEGP